MNKNERRVSFTESEKYTCLEGLEDASAFSIAKGIDLAYCGREECSAGYSFGPYVRQFYVVHIILSGKGHYRTGTGEYSLKKGDAFLIYPNEETVYWADEVEPWSYTWVGFNGVRCEDMVKKMGFSKERPIVTVKQLDSMEQAIKSMLAAKHITIANEMRRMSGLLQLFAMFIEDNDNYDEKQQLHQDYPYDAYGRATYDYIVKHYSEKIKIDDIAEHIGITRSHLTASFKKFMGMSPQEFLVNTRMERAAVLLRETAEPINAVAAQCGYEDSMSFSKVFKQKYLVSPKLYRQQFRHYSI